jgi:outer membrane protein OmpA-like peptidoglycan-associated protein
MSSLDNVAIALKSTPDRNITVEGHTDSVGSRAFNMDLSLRRAQSVRDHLVSRGLPSETVRANGVGPDRPIASNGTADGRANNRRVEIVVSPPERK